MQQPELSTHPGSSMILNLQLQQANQEYERKHPYSTSTMPAESRKSSEEDEIKSFYSCVSDSHTSRGLFNQDNFDQFPQDSCIYTVNDASFKPSWSWVPYSHHKSATQYLHCLGVFICPRDGCKHVSNVILPNKEREKNCVPKPLGSGLCFKHKCPLTHIFCNVQCVLLRTLTATEINQKGSHCHPCPHKRKPSKKAVKCLQETVMVSSEAKPQHIMLGTPTREAARSIHHLLGNMVRLTYMVSKLKSSFR